MGLLTACREGVVGHPADQRRLSDVLGRQLLPRVLDQYILPLAACRRAAVLIGVACPR